MDSSKKKKVSLIDDNNYAKLATDDIFSLMGFTDLDDEKKKELTKKMIETINARVINRLSRMLGEEKMKHFVECVDKENKEEAKEILESESIDLDKLMTEEVLAYKLDMTKGAQAIKDTMIEENNKENSNNHDQPKN